MRGSTPRRRRGRWRTRMVSAAAIMLLNLCGGAGPSGATVPADSFQTAAPYAYLVDAATGTILFEKNADTLLAPAAMAKIMTAEVVFHEIREGRLKLDDTFLVSEHAWRTGGGPAGGPAMFAALNSRVMVENLVRGLVIDAGNDAAIVLAEGIAGSEERFADLMARRAREIGLAHSTFVNPTGRADPNQRVTARDMARLATYVVATYPDLYRYFGERDFLWNRVHQYNRNPLLAMNIGADGLEGGDLPDLGYGLVGSAVQQGERLILVVDGLRTARDRLNEATKLLSWGFRSFEPRQIYAAGERVGSARVFGGAAEEVALVTPNPISLLVPRGSDEKLTGAVTYMGPLKAPVEKGAEVGRVRIYRDGMEIMSAPLRTAEAVPLGSLPHRALDAGIELLTVLVRQNFTRH